MLITYKLFQRLLCVDKINLTGIVCRSIIYIFLSRIEFFARFYGLPHWCLFIIAGSVFCDTEDDGL